MSVKIQSLNTTDTVSRVTYPGPSAKKKIFLILFAAENGGLHSC